MVALHDELFCKLAIRNGFLTQENGMELLTRFRSDASHRKNGIASFAVDEGFVDAQVAERIENAIAKRADGHVAERAAHTVKHRGGSGGHAGGDHGGGHAHPGGARVRHKERPLTQNQQIMAGGAVLVIVICGILGIYMLMKGGSNEGKSSKKEDNSVNYDNLKANEQVAVYKDPNKPTAIVKPPVTEEQLAEFRKEISKTELDAKREKMNELYHAAVKVIVKSRKEAGGDKLPEAIIAEYKKLEDEYTKYLNDEYNSQLAKARDAKNNQNAAGVEDALQYIDQRCGSEMKEKARAEIEAPAGSGSKS